MNKKEKLALFLGMLSGDGCLSITFKDGKYRAYPIQFYNCERHKVMLFDNLLFDIFGIRGNIYSRKRKDRKEIWEFKKVSKDIYFKIAKLGFPEGVKKDILKVPKIIQNSTTNEKIYFIYGVIITDGSVKKNRGIMFHSGSKLFLEELSVLISEFVKAVKPVKMFMQKERYCSYQLYLNKLEKDIILSHLPVWDNGTPSVLS